ncbi:DNA-methyltransferase [Blastococcus saxobsidens]|uniref:Methyltransferase n=1 Tax=Blastococcus saxobsidens (strain DD2) TaxID=1146883 RepID=H6RLN8_BLASD|nr:site-specific DNA-methyltransferase [Blastococcus saxobsidens]CCG03764.1 putative DNA modification methylase [Blastococcus saxobsidens DD2]
MVVRGDATELLAGLPTAGVDAVVTDPPWNLGRPYGGHDDRLPDDQYVRWLNGILRQCARISRGPVVACVGTHNAGRLPRLLAGTGLGVAARLWWHREPGSAEAVVVTAPPGWQVRGPRLDAAERVLARTPETRRRWGHPVPKPLPVMTALVRLSAPPGGLVLDPFAGSGTTLAAARRAGRRSIGVELEARFCRTAVRRLALAPTGRSERRA